MAGGLPGEADSNEKPLTTRDRDGWRFVWTRAGPDNAAGGHLARGGAVTSRSRILWALAVAVASACYPAPALEVDEVCEALAVGFRCASSVTTVATAHGEREVHFALPVGEPPNEGWPVVLAFQGSGFPAELFYTSDPALPFGAEHQGRTTRALLEQGYAVVAPEAQVNGYQYWDSNLVHRNWSWENTPDHALMVALIGESHVEEDGPQEHVGAAPQEGALASGRLGPLDVERLFAMGVSSGGYMTSRMAVSYPGRFTALAVVSASFATCGGVVCPLPPAMPDDHPPTLFLHGGRDLVVPVDSMHGYAQALEDAGVVVRRVVDEQAGHGWIPASPAEVTRFFRQPAP